MKKLSAVGSFTLLAIACLTIMVGCVIVPGLPSIAARLGVPDAASWLVTLPSLGVVLLGPLAARLIARAGLYRALLMGLFSYGLLGLAGAFLHGPGLVFTDRFLLGGATALVMAAGTGLLSSFFSGGQRLKMIALQGMSIELGGVLFLFVGGLLATLGWRWPFALYLFAWLFIAMLLLFVPQPPQEETINEAGKNSVPARSLRPVFVAALSSMVCFFTAVIVLPLHLHAQGFSEAETGYFLSFVSLVAVGAAWIMPRGVKRLGEYGTLYSAFAAYAVAHLLFATANSTLQLIAGAILMGCGFGLSVPLVNHMVVEHSPVNVRGKNLAGLSMAIFSGQFLSSFLALIPGSFSRIFTGAALIAVTAIFLLWVWQKRQKKIRVFS